MNALVHISETKYFGVSILSGVLRGSNAEKIKKNGLDKVKEYSALSYLSGEEVTRLIYWLIGRHYIIKTTGQYPVLHITSEGLKYAGASLFAIKSSACFLIVSSPFSFI